MGLLPEAVDKASPPKLHWEKLGNVTMKRSGTKPWTLRAISSEIMRARQKEAQTASDPKRDKR